MARRCVSERTGSRWRLPGRRELEILVRGLGGRAPVSMAATTHGLFLKALSALALGLSVAVGEVALYSEGQADMDAHATGTYSIPARGEAAS